LHPIPPIHDCPPFHHIPTLSLSFLNLFSVITFVFCLHRNKHNNSNNNHRECYYIVLVVVTPAPTSKPTTVYPIIYPNTGPNAKQFCCDPAGQPWGWGGGQYDGAANMQVAIAYVMLNYPNALFAMWSGSPTSGGGRINWFNVAVSASGYGTMELVDGAGWVAIVFREGYIPGVTAP
jgi:hypothetical protein